MNSEIVKQLIGINAFSINLIKLTLNARYCKCKTPFESFADIYQAVTEFENFYENQMIEE